jgi:hypothetical protein
MWNRRVLAAVLALSAGGCGAARAAVVCDATSLDLAADHGRIRAEFAIQHAERGSPWHLVVVHEGKVVWRGRADVNRRGAVWLDRRLPDYQGADHVSVRATGPRGRICSASGILAERN